MTRITDEAVEQLAELWHVPTDVRAAGKDLEREISRSTSASLEPAAKQLVSDTIRDSLAFENDMPRGHLLVQIANRAAHLLFERSVLSEAALPHLAPQPADREAFRGVYEAAASLQTAEQIAEVVEEYADDLEPPITVEWLELRDWFKDLLHEVAAKAREIGGAS